MTSSIPLQPLDSFASKYGWVLGLWIRYVSNLIQYQLPEFDTSGIILQIKTKHINSKENSIPVRGTPLAIISAPLQVDGLQPQLRGEKLFISLQTDLFYAVCHPQYIYIVKSYSWRELPCNLC
ncbi:hypothetical protein AVEN_78061-1 [Araneus ventricosus]|uniref:Uncharacterized protein n=1 Tax=Araneus ventricosus TaxID=182803 RepID=A0A4Y2D0B7_ARAVE|nr:hypothetical protein AVEN_78061-1 [Araneus ventricosus]